MRIVSLLLSATDLVCSLGLREHLVGRTHECDWPAGVEPVPVMTRDVLDTHHMSSREIDDTVGASVHSGSSIYGLDVEALAGARPDLILTQELCEVCAVSYSEVKRAARVLERGTHVVSLEPTSIDGILDNIMLVGELTGTTRAALELVAESRERLAKLAVVAPPEPVPTVCVEWLDPIYAAGHWVPEQVAAAGGRELIGPARGLSVAVEWSVAASAQPELLVCMPCGMTIERTLSEIDTLRTRPGYGDIPAVRNGRVWVVDGSSYFNRPGPRVIRGAEILSALVRDLDVLDPHEAVRVS